MLTAEERDRYARQMLVRGIGEEGQERLKRAKIVIAGVGGLGSTTALHLTAAGVGTVRLVDGDRVELSNLNRQVLHWTADVGRRKVASAAEKLRLVNPLVSIEAFDQAITEANVRDLVSGFDLVVDALDTLDARLLLNREAVRRNVPLFHGAVRAFEGRIMTVLPGRTACLRCVYRGARRETSLPVAGVTPAVVGSLQATEVIKYVVGVGTLTTDRLVVFDGLNMAFTTMAVRRDAGCPDCGPGDKGDRG